MPNSAFENLHKLTNNTGQFPDALVPASEFQLAYSYQIDLTDQLEFSTGGIVIVNIAATFDILGPDGSLLLEVALTATYECGQDEFGFTYSPTAQNITATPAVPTLGDPTGIIIQGDNGAGSASGADIIFDTFETPIYTLAIPSGSTVKIVFHTAGYPSLDDIETLQVSTRPGGGWASGFRHGTDGIAHVLHSDGGGAYTLATGRERTLQPPQALAWKPDGKLFLVRAAGRTTQVAVYAKGGNTASQVSYDDGGNWAMATLWTGYTPVGVCGRDGGQTALLTSSAGAFIAYRRRDGSVTTPAAITIPAGTKLAEGVLMGEGGGGLDFFWPGSPGLNHLHSDDELTWT